MEAPPPFPQPRPSPTTVDPNPTPKTPASKSAVDGGKGTIIIKTKKTKKKMKKKFALDPSDAPSSSTTTTTSSCSTSSHSAQQRGVRVGNKQRNPRILIGSGRQKEADVEALALPLGMSIAAVVAQVLERKDAAGETMAVDHLSQICTLAVRQSLANVFGDKFDSFARNFEKSFQSTLMTLRLINETSRCSGEHLRHLIKERNYFGEIPPMSLNKQSDLTCSSGVKDCQSEVMQHDVVSEDHFGGLEDTKQYTQTDSMNQALALHDREINQHLAHVSPSLQSITSQYMFSIFEKSVIEQTRSNDLKTFEIDLTEKKLRLKEKQLLLNSASNFLERCKLSMGFSKALFKEEKYKNELEETRHAELLKKCIDCLVAGLLIMLASIAYGTYVHSHHKITEATASCMPSKETSSWWIPKPMSSFNSGLQILWCQVQVVSRMLFGVLMIMAITYLLFQRSSNSTQTMPVTLVLLLGVGCGFAGKLCMDTLGGRGYHWLLFWEILCTLHLFSNVCTSALFFILHGPITVSQEANRNTIFPYWIRRFLFYASVLLFLPLLCGLIPFASPTEWLDHFSLRMIDYLQATND